MKTSGEKKNLAGGVLNRNQLTTVAVNLASRKTGPVTILKNAQPFTQLSGLIPTGTKHDSQIKILDLSPYTDCFDELVARIARFKGPGCFGHGLVVHVV
jgi:hypothetical protein